MSNPLSRVGSYFVGQNYHKSFARSISHEAAALAGNAGYQLAYQLSFFLYRNYDRILSAEPIASKIGGLTGVALIATGLLGRFQMIKGTNAISQWSMIGVGTFIELLLAGWQFYSHRMLHVANPFPDGERAEEIREEHVRKIQHYALANFQRAMTAVMRGKATEMLFRFLDDPKKELILHESVFEHLNVYLFPLLHECACTNSENFNRFKNSRRSDLEQQMLDNVQKTFPPSDERTLRYLGFGTGGLLQDFINVGKLIRAGYKHLDVVLVDSNYHDNNEIEHKKYNSLLQLQFGFLLAVAKELKISLNISYIDSIHKVKDSCHIIQVIDFDDFDKAFKDVMAAHDLLVEGGRFYLAYSNYDLVMDESRCLLSTIYGENDQENSLLADIESNLVQDVKKTEGKEIRVAFLSDENKMLQWVKFARCIGQASEEGAHISLTLIQPQERNFFGSSKDEPNIQFDSKGLSKFLSLLCEKQVEVTLIPSFDEFKDSQQEYDIITNFGCTDAKSNIESHIVWLRKNHSGSNLYFLVSATAESNDIAWQGAWKWDESGTQFFGQPSREHKDAIEKLMSDHDFNN